MANIDELNFEVILNDDAFNQKVQADIKLAKELNVQLSTLLNIKKQVGNFSQADVTNNRKAQQILVDNAKAQERITREKIKTEGVQKRINAQIDKATRGYQSQSRILNELKGIALGYLSVQGASQLLSSLVRVTGEFELQKTTLAAMLGDLNKAEQVITKIQGLAVESPFQFKELTTYAKQLSAFSVPAEELYETTKMLADVSAGLGVGMDRIVLAYGQVRSAAFLRGQEVRQFTEAGIPILDELAKQFTELEGRAVSTGEVFDKISARLVPFEMVAKVFKDMTSEGGKFYNMQEVQAETLRGKISNLKDAYEVMLNEIGKGQSENLKGAVDWARRLMQNYEETGRTLVSLIASYGVYKTTLLGLEVVTNTFSAANHKLIGTLMNAGKWLLANPYAAIAAAITAAGYATYKWATHMTDAEKIQKSVSDSHEKYTEALSSEYSMLEALYAKLDLYTEGTLEHDKAKAQIMRKYAPYIEQLRQEGVEVDNLANIYGNLADKIRESLQTRFYEYSMQDLDLAYKDAEDKARKMLANSIKANQKEYGFTEKDKLSLSLYVLGGIDEEKAFANMTESAKQYFTDFNVFLNKQRDNMAEARNAYLEGIDDVSDAYQTFQAEAEQTPDKLSLFAETVQKELAKFGATKDNKGKFAGLWADNMTEYYDYIDKLRKGYDDIKQKIKDVGTTQKENLPDLKRQKEAIEAIAKALDISLDKGDYGKGKSQAQIDLEAQIDLVKKLQDAYEKLRPYEDDKTMKDTLAKFFPDAKQEWIDSLDFTTVIKALADELEKYDKNAAERLRNSIGKTGIDGEVERLKNLHKGYKDAAEAAGKYFNELRRWSAEDFTIDGEGVAFDIGKIASDLQESFNKIDLRAQKTREIFSQIGISDTQKPSEDALAKIKALFEKEFGEGSWDKFYDEFLSKGLNAIEDLSNKQRDYERKLAQERLNDLAKRYVDEQTDSLNLSDWGDKSISQIESIRQRLISLKNEDIQLPQSTVDALAALGLSVDDLIAKIRELFGEELGNASIEKFKALSDIIGEVTSMASSLGDQLTELGETMGDDFLKGFGKALKSLDELTQILTECDSLMQAFSNSSKDAAEDVEEIVEETSEIADAEEEAADGMKGFAKSADWVTMVIKLVVSLIGKVVSGINESQQAIQEARLAAIEYANALNQIEFDNLMTSFESAFGTDAYGKALTAMQKAKEYQDAILESQKQIGVTSQDLGDFQMDSSGWSNFSKGLQDAWKRIKDLGEGDILVDMRTGWQKFWGTGNDLIKTFSLSDFIDEDGMLKGEELREFYETYGEDISDANAAAIEEILGQYDLYVDAVEEVTSYMSDMFGNVADSMADSFIEAFKQSGQAALDYGDIMDEVATNIARSVIKSMLLQSVFTEQMEKDAAEKLASGDTARAMAVVEQAMQAAQDLSPHIQAFLEEMEPYFKMETETQGTTDLASGIKGITEDQANLLASYLNAIRADVSYSKTLWVRMDANLQRIADMFVSSPTLMEYQAQIAANTYNTSIATQEILAELRSVVTTDTGDPSIRVYS